MVSYSQITVAAYKAHAPRLQLDPNNIRDVPVNDNESPTFNVMPEAIVLHHTGSGRGSVASSISYITKLLNGGINHVHYNEGTTRGGIHLVGRTTRASWNAGWGNSAALGKARRGEHTAASWSQRPASYQDVSPASSARMCIGHVVDINGIDEPLVGTQFEMFTGICAIRLFLMGWPMGKQLMHRTYTTRKPDIHDNRTNSDLDKAIWDSIARKLALLKSPVMPPVNPPIGPAVPELPYSIEEDRMFLVYLDVPFKRSGAGSVSANGALGKGGTLVSATPRTSHTGPHPLTGAVEAFWTNNDTKNGNLFGIFPQYQGDVNCDVVVRRA